MLGYRDHLHGHAAQAKHSRRHLEGCESFCIARLHQHSTNAYYFGVALDCGTSPS